MLHSHTKLQTSLSNPAFTWPGITLRVIYDHLISRMSEFRVTYSRARTVQDAVLKWTPQRNTTCTCHENSIWKVPLKNRAVITGLSGYLPQAYISLFIEVHVHLAIVPRSNSLILNDTVSNQPSVWANSSTSYRQMGHKGCNNTASFIKIYTITKISTVTPFCSHFEISIFYY